MTVIAYFVALLVAAIVVFVAAIVLLPVTVGLTLVPGFDASPLRWVLWSGAFWR